MTPRLRTIYTFLATLTATVVCQFGCSPSVEHKSVDELVALLRNENPKVRFRAATRLGEIRDPRAIAPLIEALSDTSRFKFDMRTPPALRENDVQGYVSLALSEFGPDAIEPLAHAAKDSDPWRRKGALNALGRIDDVRVLDPVLDALGDPDFSVRVEAVHMLGWISRTIEDPRIPQALLRMLASTGEDDRLRYFAIGSLTERVRPESVQPITRALASDPSDSVREEAARALGKLSMKIDAKNSGIADALQAARRDPKTRETAELALRCVNREKDLPLFCKW
jgi:HEAT repeat protein